MTAVVALASGAEVTWTDAAYFEVTPVGALLLLTVNGATEAAYAPSAWVFAQVVRS